MAAAARKSIQEFTVESRVQTEWKWLIAAAFFLGGVGAGMFIISQYVDYRLGMVIGFLVVAVGKSAAHLLYLGRPLRFWRAFVRPGRSWISRGMIAIAAFVVFALLYMAPKFEAFSGLPWAAGTGLGDTIKVLAGLSAFMVMIYTGFVMAYSPSIPFWNTSLLPLLFVTYAFLGGIGLMFFTFSIAGEPGVNVRLLESAEIFLIALAVIILLSYLGTMYTSTVGAKEAVRTLVAGHLSLPFMGGAVFLGLLIPLVIALYYAAGPPGPVAYAGLGAAGITELVGSFFLRYSLLRAGYYNPVL